MGQHGRRADYMVEEPAALGIDVRAGLDTAEFEVLVSGIVKDLVAGSGIRFEQRGVRRLEGVADDWTLLRGHGPAPVP